jgi:hypothetical protein
MADPLANLKWKRESAALAVSRTKDECEFDLFHYYEGKRDGLDEALKSLDGMVILSCEEAEICRKAATESGAIGLGGLLEARIKEAKS